ncbi:MAG: PDZ domain-containing protein [Burkholderiaceae bacterium]|nr:MAG: PDZ domain-containing protein [Burkholderiaceae bacterium]
MLFHCLRRALSASLLAVAAILAGCANGYSQFYRASEAFTPETIAARRVAPPTGQPIVEHSNMPGPNDDSILTAYAKRGYVMIGSAFFNTGNAQSEGAAVEQGRKVGADVVLIMNPRYTGSTTTAVPLTTPTTTTSYSTGTATAYGSGGVVNAYGSGTTTTYGQTTTMIPITVHRSDYGAAYFVKIKWGFGALWRDLSDSERQELQSNKGAVITVVVDNTPAFDADILPGDIIVAVNGAPVAGVSGLGDQLRAAAGAPVNVSLVRRGARVEKTVRMQ